MAGKRWAGIGLLLLAMTGSGWAGADDYYLYAPRKVEPAPIPASPAEGVLVKEITIRRGDTLYGLARTYRGKGSFYPQLLVFNEISNPNLIYAGRTLRIPLSRELGSTGEAVPRPTAKPEAKAAPASPTPVPAKISTVQKTVPPPVGAAQPVPAAKATSTERKLFEEAVGLYKRGSYAAAKDAFDRFLATYPTSPLAADVTLYRADTYLKLSAQ